MGRWSVPPSVVAVVMVLQRVRSAASSSSSNWTPSPLQSEHLTLEREVRAARRSSRPIGVAMVDIDHFKLYNDHYGHPAGDDCLAEVAALIRAQVRPADLAARYGGEELVIVMPETRLDAGRTIAERIRSGIAERAIPSEGSPGRIVTVSIGVAACRPAATPP